MDADELKKLSPEERIKRLKELEESRKQEIEEARKLIRESEEEIDREQEQKKQVPIPQIRADSIEHLVSPEEKGVYATKRFVSEGPRQHEVSVEEHAEHEVELEEAVGEHELPQKEAEAEQRRQYQIAGVEEQTKSPYDRGIFEEYNAIKQDVFESGYVREEIRQRAGEQIKHIYDRLGPERMAEEMNTGRGLTKQFIEWYKG